MTDATRDLAPDEKLCPFCAETIKAAAIKCRFCHSDLPAPDAVESSAGISAATPDQADAVDRPDPEIAPVEIPQPPDRLADAVPDAVSDAGPDAVSDAVSDPGPDVVEPAEPDDDAHFRPVAYQPDDEHAPLELGGRAGPLGMQLVAVLVVLCLVLGGALWYVVHRADHPHLDTAPNGQVTSNSFRNAAMSAASDAAKTILSYSYKTFDADRKKAHAVLGPSLTKQYDKAMDQVAGQTASAKLTLKAGVLAAGLLSAEEHDAKVLLFVNTVTTREGSAKQQLDQNRVVMELTRKDGDWTVSKMDAF